MTISTYFATLLELWATYIPWVILAIARPFGFTLLFAVFAWAKLGSGILRLIFAIAIAIPLLANGIPSSDIQLEMAYPVILFKELTIGALLGFVSSIPLAIAVAGGGIVDIYRGALQGAPDPAGGKISPYGSLFAVTSLWLFASIGGFQIITSTIYASYDIWELNSVFPVFNPDAVIVLNVLEKILLGAVVLASPLLIIMFLSDIIHMIAAKFGTQIDVTYLTFSTKNLIAIIILPMLLVISIRVLKDDWSFLNTVPGFVRGIIS